jgi:hypothetical protein
MCFQLPFHYGEPTHQEGERLGHRLANKYENVFAFSMKDLSRCKTMQFSIDLTDETPELEEA